MWLKLLTRDTKLWILIAMIDPGLERIAAKSHSTSLLNVKSKLHVSLALLV